jgi:hypothetical protein
MTTKIRPSTLEDTTVSAGTYGSSNTIVGVYTVDAQGRITYAANATIRSATTSQTGVVQLTDSVSSTSTSTAATPNSVKTVNDSLTTEITDRQANVGAGLISTTSAYQANVGAAVISTTSAYQANTGAALIAAKSYTTSQGYLTSVGTSNITNAAVTAAKLSGAQSGSAPVFGVRAWANFAGDGSNGACVVNASGNISGVVKNGTGDYTVSFTTAMDDANYAISVFASALYSRTVISSQTASSFRFSIANPTDNINSTSVQIMVIR